MLKGLLGGEDQGNERTCIEIDGVKIVGIEGSGKWREKKRGGIVG